MGILHTVREWFGPLDDVPDVSLGDMFPCATRNDCLHGAMVDTEPSTKLSKADSCRMLGSYDPDVRFGHLGIEIPDASGRSALRTSTLNPILIVRKRSTRQEMRRIAAWGIITDLMAYSQTVWNWPVRENPRDPVSAMGSPFAITGYRKAPVAIFIHSALPWPTRIRATALINLRPKAIIQPFLPVGRSLVCGARCATAYTFPALNFAWGNEERNAAPCTSSLYTRSSFSIGEHSDRLLHRLIGVSCRGLLTQRSGLLRTSIIPKTPVVRGVEGNSWEY